MKFFGKIKLVLALALVFGLAAANLAMAEPAPIPTDPNTYADVTKVIQRPMGVGVPEVTFTFTTTPLAFNGGAPGNAANFPSIGAANLSSADGVSPDIWVDTVPEVLGIKSTERTARFELGTLVFNQPGTYDYLVEVAPTSHEDVVDTEAAFVLRLTVTAGADGNAISNVATYTFENGAAGTPAPARFVSTYTPYGSMSVRKEVSGPGGETSTEFNFRIRLTATAFTPADATFTANIVTDAGNSPSRETKTFDKWYDFTLQHGWTMQIDDVPLGTAFMVEEKAATDYTPSVAVVINGQNPFTFTAEGPDRALSTESALGQSFLVENRVIGAGENSVLFTNYNPTAAMGNIWMDNIVWFALAGFVFIAFVGFIIFLKKRDG
ncbi:MAG: DUF5979 domain-containing protein [Coriobacteriia bacterium]|nr:DUF5979 domain-containing protein [Coriobacteriia bacterium]MCL2536825.1 DUF5979 domain-containing protein [Coriobacteriia bacterium]